MLHPEYGLGKSTVGSSMTPVTRSSELLLKGGPEGTMFAKLPPVKTDLYPFALSMLVFDPKYSPRHPMFELWVDRGMDMIDAVLNHQLHWP